MKFSDDVRLVLSHSVMCQIIQNWLKQNILVTNAVEDVVWDTKHSTFTIILTQKAINYMDESLRNTLKRSVFKFQYRIWHA